MLCWSLDRLGRSLKHLITLLDDLHSIGVGVVTLKEGLDWTTPTGRLQAQLLGIIAEFERERIRERVKLGMARAKAQGVRVGRPRKATSGIVAPKGLTVRRAAELWGVSKSTAARRINEGLLPTDGDVGQSSAQVN